jgi:hypothetical protein
MSGQSNPDDANPDDAKLRKKAAESLQHQIDEAISGRTQPGGPESFRDFVDRKMAEDKKKAPTDKPAETKKEKSP